MKDETDYTEPRDAPFIMGVAIAWSIMAFFDGEDQ